MFRHLQLIAEPGLNLLGCCNELNASYAAKGYGRARRIGENVVAFTVGRLKCAERDRGMNSNDYGTSRILHHTIGLPDFTQELQCFQTVTCHLGKRLRVVLQTIDHGDSEVEGQTTNEEPRNWLCFLILAFTSAARYDGEGNKLFDPRPHTVSLLEFGAVEDGTQGDGTLPGSKMLMEIPRKAKDEITVCCQ
ncbi:hypothetical protein ACFX2I_028262 [Malus domestica]